MQNRYTGDIGDFGKYALLNALAGHDLKLGVVWYLYPDAEPNGDGQFVAYPELRPCNPGLHDALAAIVASGDRRVAAVEQCGILPFDTGFYSAPLSFAICRRVPQSHAGHADLSGFKARLPPQPRLT